MYEYAESSWHKSINSHRNLFLYSLEFLQFDFVKKSDLFTKCCATSGSPSSPPHAFTWRPSLIVMILIGPWHKPRFKFLFRHMLQLISFEEDVQVYVVINLIKTMLKIPKITILLINCEKFYAFPFPPPEESVRSWQSKCGAIFSAWSVKLKKYRRKYWEM